VWALESAERHGRPTCTECTDKLRKKRGCKKPGFDVEGESAFRFSSPLLNESGNEILRECPTGAVMRDAPWVYDVLGLYAYAEHGGFEIQRQPRWVQSALQVIGSEKERLRRLAESEKQGKGDAAYARRLVKG
jgi:hypothetical protein